MALRQFSASIMDRYPQHVHPEPNTGCWLCTSKENKDGYARLALSWRESRRTIGAHRVSYEISFGRIPDGMELDHLCRVRCCVNPEHLELVTREENNRRMNAYRERMSGYHCPNGHLRTESNIYHHPRGARLCRECRRSARLRYSQKAGA